jgi:hypothetical protein
VFIILVRGGLIYGAGTVPCWVANEMLAKHVSGTVHHMFVNLERRDQT